MECWARVIYHPTIEDVSEDMIVLRNNICYRVLRISNINVVALNMRLLLYRIGSFQFTVVKGVL